MRCGLGTQKAESCSQHLEKSPVMGASGRVRLCVAMSARVELHNGSKSRRDVPGWMRGWRVKGEEGCGVVEDVDDR